MAALKFMKRKAPHGHRLRGTLWEQDRGPGGRRELSDLRVYHVLDGVCSVGDVIGHKMAGIPVEVVYGDDQLKPDVGVQVAEEMLKKDHADFVSGIIWSNVMVAVVPVVTGAGHIMVGTNAGASPLAGSQCGQQALPQRAAVGGEEQGGDGHRARDEWSGHPGAPHLLDEQDHVEQRTVAATEIARDQESRPAELGHPPPELLVEAALVERQPLRRLRGAVPAQEVAGGGHEQLLG